MHGGAGPMLQYVTWRGRRRREISYCTFSPWGFYIQGPLPLILVWKYNFLLPVIRGQTHFCLRCEQPTGSSLTLSHMHTRCWRPPLSQAEIPVSDLDGGVTVRLAPAVKAAMFFWTWSDYKITLNFIWHKSLDYNTKLILQYDLHSGATNQLTCVPR